MLAAANNNSRLIDGNITNFIVEQVDLTESFVGSTFKVYLIFAVLHNTLR